ncbi:MAG: VOC family protein [Betaproteobacteria bacterium]|nr:VOC family protein [Betaproteobacteria bacterium]
MKENAMLLQSFHHVAYRCNNSQETVDFYTKLLGAKFTGTARARTRHPDHSEFLHTFLSLEDGSSIAFFEVPEREPMGWDPNTPSWVQHIAFRVKSADLLPEMKARLEAAGVEVAGPYPSHHTVTSIYFLDPSGHRLELAALKEIDRATAEKKAWEDLARWNVERVELAARRLKNAAAAT